MTALFRNVRDCKFVEESKGMEGSGVFFFRNFHGRGVVPKDVTSQEESSSWAGHLPAAWGVDTKTAEVMQK